MMGITANTFDDWEKEEIAKKERIIILLKHFNICQTELTNNLIKEDIIRDRINYNMKHINEIKQELYQLGYKENL